MNNQKQKNQSRQAPKTFNDLHPKEVELIKLIREKFRFGKITVILHDGLPQRIEETIQYTAL